MKVSLVIASGVSHPMVNMSIDGVALLLAVMDSMLRSDTCDRR